MTKRYIIQRRNNKYRIWDTIDHISMWLERRPKFDPLGSITTIPSNGTTTITTSCGNSTVTLPQPTTGGQTLTVSSTGGYTTVSNPWTTYNGGNSLNIQPEPINEFDSKDLDYVYNKCKEMNDDLASWEEVDEELIKELYAK